MIPGLDSITDHPEIQVIYHRNPNSTYSNKLDLLWDLIKGSPGQFRIQTCKDHSFITVMTCNGFGIIPKTPMDDNRTMLSQFIELVQAY